MLDVKLMWCSGLPLIYGQLEEGLGSVYHDLFGVVVFHESMVNWRRGQGLSVMKLIQCSGLTLIYGQLEEGGRGQSVIKIIWCNGLPQIHTQL